MSDVPLHMNDLRWRKADIKVASLISSCMTFSDNPLFYTAELVLELFASLVLVFRN